MLLSEFINGTLLGDGCIVDYNSKYGKYFSYKLTAKDKKFLKWNKEFLEKSEISNSWITKDKRNHNYSLYFYINACPFSKTFLDLRNKWYKPIRGKTRKIVPKNLKLNPSTLLHWYLGDGSLSRRKEPSNYIPSIVLATNGFRKSDVLLLRKKLQKLNLNFSLRRHTSGFNKGEYCGYALWSKTEDGTPLRFFQTIGIKTSEGIENCVTGRKGRGSKLHYFKNKWPTEDEWLRIFSNEKFMGEIIKEIREKLNIFDKTLSQNIGAHRGYVKRIERGERNAGASNLRKIFDILAIRIDDVFKWLNANSI